MTCGYCHQGASQCSVPANPSTYFPQTELACSQVSAWCLPAGACCPVSLIEGHQRGLTYSIWCIPKIIRSGILACVTEWHMALPIHVQQDLPPSPLPLYQWWSLYAPLLPSVCRRAEKKRVPKRKNEFLSLSASSSDKCRASDYGQERGIEMNKLGDATHDAENIKEQTMKTGGKLLTEHFSEAEGKLQEIKLLAEAKHAFYWLQN